MIPAPSDRDPGDETQPRAIILQFPSPVLDEFTPFLPPATTLPNEAQVGGADRAEALDIPPLSGEAAALPTTSSSDNLFFSQGPPKSGDCADLDALLADSMAQSVMEDLAKLEAKREARIVAEARRKLALLDGGGLTGLEREALRARILRWEAENEWLPQQFVYVEEIDLCACGAASFHFLGLYQIQVSRARKAHRRLVLWSPQELTPDCATLTRTWHQVGRVVPFCSTCRERAGFALRYDGQLWAQAETQARASATQTVEDLGP